jgi:hypothetical protein
MAMTFTLVTACREALSGVVSTRLIREQEEEDRKTKAYEEVSSSCYHSVSCCGRPLISRRRRLEREEHPLHQHHSNPSVNVYLPNSNRSGIKKKKTGSKLSLQERGKISRNVERGYPVSPTISSFRFKAISDEDSGRQLFETSKVTVDADEGYYEEGATEIDLSKYTREEREKERRREEEEEEKRREGLLADGED